MAALTFDKRELGNLEYSLTREMLATDRRGGYMSTTIVGCNTRKYHGLMVAPIDDSDRAFVLLSSLDETIVRDDQEFNLALHRFRGVYEPRGHKYITDFEYTPTPTMTYRIGDAVIKKELLWIHKRTQLMVRYTFVEGSRRPVTLKLRPFLAFRDRHELSKANMYADGRSYEVKGGVKCRLYDGFPWLYMQMSRDEFEFVPAPDWYYDFEYSQELARGFEGHEDLLTPGYFETQLKVGESVILSVSTEEMESAAEVTKFYEASLERRTHKVDFMSCLRHSARQFVIRNGKSETTMVAGYPWYGTLGRMTLFSLPGLTLEQGNKEDCIDAMDLIVKQCGEGSLDYTMAVDNAVDTPLWFAWLAQKLEHETSAEFVWERYGDMLRYVIRGYSNGEFANGGNTVEIHDNGLLWAWSDEKSLTWLDPTVGCHSARYRNGYSVEVNAMWYNALCYVLELAKKFNDRQFVEEWKWAPEMAKSTFNTLFWHGEGWLADYVNHEEKNISIRPNMIFACALPYKMLNYQQIVDVIRVVRQHLLTPRGLRTLSPENPMYKSGADVINLAPKNGTVWPWMLSLYARSCFYALGDAFKSEAIDMVNNFESEIQSYGIGTIGEFFEADPPFNPRGAISQASSVASVLGIVKMIKEFCGVDYGVVEDEPEVVAAPKPKAKRAPRAAAKPKTTRTRKVAPKE